jgi:hypothetical protein
VRSLVAERTSLRQANAEIERLHLISSNCSAISSAAVPNAVPRDVSRHFTASRRMADMDGVP